MIFTSTIYGIGSWAPIQNPNIEEPLEIFVPKTVSSWSEYEIKIVINDQDILENANKIKIDDFYNVIILPEKSKIKALEESGEYEYSGQEELNLVVVAKEMVSQEYIEKNEKFKYTTFKIQLIQEEILTPEEYETHPIKKTDHYVDNIDGKYKAFRTIGKGEVTYEVANPTIEVTKPQEYPMSDQNIIYDKGFIFHENTTHPTNQYDVLTLSLTSGDYIIDMEGNIGVGKPLSEDKLNEAFESQTQIIDKSYPLVEAPEALIKNLGMEKGVMRTSIQKFERSGAPIGYESYYEYQISRVYSFYKDGRFINFKLYNRRGYDSNKIDSYIDELFSTFESVIYSFQVVEQYEGEYAIPKVDVHGPIEFNLSLISDGRTVFNNGVYNTGSKTDSAFTPVVKVEKKGDYNPDEKLYLYGEIVNYKDDCAVGFVRSDNTLSNTITYREDSVVSVLMRTYGKEKHPKFRPEEKIEFKLKDSSGKIVSNTETFTVKIVDAAPKVIFNNPNPSQMQSESESSFGFKVIDPDSGTIKLSIRTPFGSLKGKDGKWSKKIEMNVKPGDSINLGFKSPEVGNFLLNKELENLSMVALQEGTILQAIADLEAIGIGRFKKGLESKADLIKRIQTYDMDLENYEEKMAVFNTILSNKKLIDKWDNINQLMTDINNIAFVSQVQQQGKQMGEELNEAFTFKNKSISESGSDIGIAAISLLQTGVGGFAAAASYITGGDGESLEVGADKIAAFNLMANVWKGNLKYWSKVEKIDRAEERIEMIPIIVIAVDEGGLEHRGVLMIPVVGLEV